MGRKISLSNDVYIEQEQAEKARRILEERLQNLHAEKENCEKDAINPVGKNTMLSEEEIEAARLEAEKRREERRAEVIISSKLYAKEQRARASASEAKRRARAEVRSERERRAFEETKADLEEAERKRQMRLEARQMLKETNVVKKELTQAEKEKVRADYARRDLERAEAARVAETAMKALQKLGHFKGAETKKSLVLNTNESTKKTSTSTVVKISRPISSMTTMERTSRRMVLEALRALGDGASFDAIRNLVARATTLGLADDCPELLEARVREHNIGLKRAKANVERVNDELAFAISNHAKLKEQGFHRAVDRAFRRVEITRQKKTEVEGAVQYHEARGQAAAASLQREFAVRTEASRPLYMLDEESDDLNKESQAVDDDESDDDLRVSPSRRKGEINNQQELQMAVINKARKKARRQAINRNAQRQVIEAKLVRAAATQKKIQAEARARETERFEARIAAAARAKQRLREQEEINKEIARRAELRAEAAAASEAAECAAQRLRKIAETKSSILDDADSLRRATRDRRVQAEVARRYAEDLLVHSERRISKLAIHFFHADTDELNLSLQLQVPATWYTKPATKLLSVFIKTYNTRKQPYQITLNEAALATATGNELPAELQVQEALALSHGTLRIIHHF